MKVRTEMSTNYLKDTFFQNEVHRQKVEQVLDSVMESDAAPVEDEVRDKQVLIRVSELQREQWQTAAEADGLSVSEWLRQMADHRWREIYTCTHPVEHRKSYPWAEFCLDCGTRLR